MPLAQPFNLSTFQPPNPSNLPTFNLPTLQPSYLLPKGCLWHNRSHTLTPTHIFSQRGCVLAHHTPSIYLPYTYTLPTPSLTPISNTHLTPKKPLSSHADLWPNLPYINQSNLHTHTLSPLPLYVQTLPSSIIHLPFNLPTLQPSTLQSSNLQPSNPSTFKPSTFQPFNPSNLQPLTYFNLIKQQRYKFYNHF